MTTAPLSTHHADAFAEAASAALDRLRKVTAGLLESIPNLDPARPVDVANALGLDLKLAWRMFRLARAADPFEGARHVPGAVGYRIWTEAAAAHAAPKALVREAGEAYAQLQEVIDRFAGSRKAFDLMIAGLASTDGDTRLAFEHRRQMFLGASYVWGIQSRANFRCDIVAPSGEAGRLDLVSIRGIVGLRRLRPEVSWRFRTAVSIDDKGNLRLIPDRRPVDDRASDPERLAPPLLEEFCTEPLPNFRAHDLGGGWVEFEACGGDVGREGEQTIVVAEVIRGHETIVRTDEFHGFHHLFTLRTPTELGVFDILCHRDVFGSEGEFDLVHNSDLHHCAVREGRPHRSCDRLPGPAHPDRLGRGLTRAGMREIPFYNEMLAKVFAKVGWSPDQFELHRARVPFPAIPSTIVYEREFPDRDRATLED